MFRNSNVNFYVLSCVHCLFLPKASYREYIGGCCSGRNELNPGINCADYSTYQECLDASKEWCDSNSDCVSFETHEAGSKSVPPTGNIQFSTSCLSNDKPGGDCGHILYIKNKSNANIFIFNSFLYKLIPN